MSSDVVVKSLIKDYFKEEILLQECCINKHSSKLDQMHNGKPVG